MSGRNFVCVECGNAAEVQCSGCPSGQQCYCTVCAVRHVRKGGAHLLHPVGAPINSHQDAEAYNSRYQHIIELKSMLDITHQVISTETSNLQVFLAQHYQCQVESLQKAYEEIGSQLQRYYHDIEQDIDRIRQELDGCLASMNPPSPYTVEFIQKAGHMQPSNEVLQSKLLRVLPRISQGEQVGTEQRELLRLCEVWGGRMCGCERCGKMRSALLGGERTERRAATDPGRYVTAMSPVKHPSSLQSTWSCSHCTRTNPIHLPLCFNCSAQNLSETQFWSCIQCKIVNPPSSPACQQCQMKRGLSSFLQKKGVILSSDFTKWKCPSCFTLTCLRSSQCTNCSQKNTILASVLTQ